MGAGRQKDSNASPIVDVTEFVTALELRAKETR
jgi:hypothetical protein